MTQPLPVNLPTVTLVIDDPELRECYALRVPGSTEAEGWQFLQSLSDGAAGAGSRQLLMGATYEPIRRLYAARDAQIAHLAHTRLQALGPSPTLGQLTDIAQSAARDRAWSARMWRLPSGPDVALLLEARDWRQYGVGGRTLPNLVRRNQLRDPSLTPEANLRRVIGSAGRTNATVDASVLRHARALRTGGTVLMVLGAGLTLREYQQTSTAERPEFIRREAAGFAGGAIAAGLATAVLLTFALPGLVVVGLGLIAGVAGGWAGQRLYLAARGSEAERQAQRNGVVSAQCLSH
jgi:hypothetical protein